MYEDIDLRPYLKILQKNWLWLVGATVLLPVIAFIGTQFVPPVYEATALVVVDTQEDLLQFDPRIRSEDDTQLLDAYPELAMSDAVMVLVAERIGRANSMTSTELQKLLNANAGEDPRLIQLTVQEQNPELAAEIANAWAEELIDWINALYGARSGETLAFYEEELITAKTDLENAETELIAFQAVNRTEVISNTLQTLYQTQAIYLTQINEINQITEDIANMRTLLGDGSTAVPVSFSDQLTLLSIQTQMFNTEENSFILQLSPEIDISFNSRDEQVQLLDRLANIAAEQKVTTELNLAELEPEILLLQQQIQEELIKHQSLMRDHVIAEENYLSLARKVAEERILAEDTTSAIRLISKATIADTPVDQNLLSTLLVAAALGFSLCAAALLFFYWWQQPE